jgi:hypothetical protein
MNKIQRNKLKKGGIDSKYKEARKAIRNTVGQSAVDQFERLYISSVCDEFGPLNGFSSSLYVTNDLDAAGLVCKKGLVIHKLKGLHGSATWLGKDKVSAVKSIVTKHKDAVFGVVIDMPLQDKSLPVFDIIEKIRRVPNHLTDRFSDILSKSIDKPSEYTDEDLNPEVILPPKWIRGILDLKALKFIKNPDYNPSLDEDDINHIKDYLDKIKTDANLYQELLNANTRKERRERK